jgi:hypothetical protein
LAEAFKLIILPATKDGMTRAELHQYLEFNHGPLVMRYPDVSSCFTEYIHHYVESEAALRAGCDAVTTISFASLAGLQASKANENYRLHVGPDEDNFRDEATSRAYSGQVRMIRNGSRVARYKLLIFRRLSDCTDSQREWENHVIKRLNNGSLSVGRVSINRLAALGGSCEYDILDEISLDDAACASAIEAELSEAPSGLLVGDSATLITRPRIFV